MTYRRWHGRLHPTEEHRAGSLMCWEDGNPFDPYPGSEWFFVFTGRNGVRGPFKADNPHFGPVEYDVHEECEWHRCLFAFGLWETPVEAA